MSRINKIEEEQRRYHIQQQRRYEVFWRAKIFYALRKQKKPFLDAAKNDGLVTAWAQIDVLIKPTEIVNVLTRMYKDIVLKDGPMFLNQYMQMKAGFGLSETWLEALTNWMQSFFLQMVSNMTEYTKKILLEIILKGIEAGDSYDLIIDELSKTGIDKVRAAAIARTETNRGLGFAKYEAIGRLPYTADPVWISGRNKRTRGADADDKADHYHMNEQIVPYRQPFKDPRSGASMLFPGDVSLGAQAKDVVNCRCTIAARRRK